MFFAPMIRTHSAPVARGFDRSFERFLNDSFFSPVAPRVQLEQDDKAWTITLDVPGVARESLSIDIEGAVVRIQTQPEAKRQFKAAYELPEEIDADATTAQLENGVLTLTLGKKQPVSTARRIEIR